MNEETKQLEIKAIIEAEKAHYDKALSLLTTAIDKTPYKCSLWNNRGQVYRLMNKDEGSIRVM